MPIFVIAHESNKYVLDEYLFTAINLPTMKIVSKSTRLPSVPRVILLYVFVLPSSHSLFFLDSKTLRLRVGLTNPQSKWKMRIPLTYTTMQQQRLLNYNTTRLFRRPSVASYKANVSRKADFEPSLKS